MSRSYEDIYKDIIPKDRPTKDENGVLARTVNSQEANGNGWALQNVAISYEINKGKTGGFTVGDTRYGMGGVYIEKESVIGNAIADALGADNTMLKRAGQMESASDMTSFNDYFGGKYMIQQTANERVENLIKIYTKTTNFESDIIVDKTEKATRDQVFKLVKEGLNDPQVAEAYDRMKAEYGNGSGGHVINANLALTDDQITAWSEIREKMGFNTEGVGSIEHLTEAELAAEMIIAKAYFEAAEKHPELAVETSFTAAEKQAEAEVEEKQTRAQTQKAESEKQAAYEEYKKKRTAENNAKDNSYSHIPGDGRAAYEKAGYMPYNSEFEQMWRDEITKASASNTCRYHKVQGVLGGKALDTIKIASETFSFD